MSLLLSNKGLQKKAYSKVSGDISLCISRPSFVSNKNSWRGLPRWLGSKRIHLPVQEMQVQSLSGAGNVTPLQYSCLENPMDGRAWRAAVHGVAKNRIWLSTSLKSSWNVAVYKKRCSVESVLEITYHFDKRSCKWPLKVEMLTSRSCSWKQLLWPSSSCGVLGGNRGCGGCVV